MKNVTNSNSTYNEMYVAFAMEKNSTQRFELITGFHPFEKRMLTEREERQIFSFLSLVNHTEIINSKVDLDYIKTAKLYLKLFPELHNYLGTSEQSFYKKLWQVVLNEVLPVKIGYVFSPYATATRTLLKDKIDKFKSEFHDLSYQDLRTKNKIVWTMPFPASSEFGVVVEEKVGIGSALKGGISINQFPSGFLSNYLLNSQQSFDKLLNANQFEELVGVVYENEGWKIKRTKKTRDGGKDLIATKITDSGEKIMAYIEAKKPDKNKIKVEQVREFYGVIRDETNRGYFVTSSVFTRDAKRWLQKKLNLAPVTIELIEGKELISKLSKLIDGNAFTYFHNTTP
ncbi:restriction endonuclease [Adhaeribacter swui]|uniref:Restriction endonuclease n=1 Tax=Adhaeribacter swui TaxID=2086471 RepID=A0A7G7GBF6_9BACT|nr:restriction endonuclease [Adhaeribacter swui]QNF34490.1 restriction endonuclease [Adhaeribacter swui]